MTSEDRAAFEHYDDDAHRETAAGEARRRDARTLNRHIAVRFPAETIESVRRLAQPEGMTVSAWIRRAVDEAIRRRQRE
jgi:predicted DNA binding CopG/RHH family protein